MHLKRLIKILFLFIILQAGNCLFAEDLTVDTINKKLPMDLIDYYRLIRGMPARVQPDSVKKRINRTILHANTVHRICNGNRVCRRHIQ